ncbi:MAG: two-component regulator propeller domain-containing protein, partial [Verrucomicrobiota bacterium]
MNQIPRGASCHQYWGHRPAAHVLLDAVANLGNGRVMPPARPLALLCWVSICMGICTGRAQTSFTTPDFTCRGWQVDDGLPNNSVASLLQARDGYLWLGTYDGFVRFDGRQFKAFRLSPEHAFLADGILRLCEDDNGAIWGVTDRGRVLVVEGETVRVAGVDPRLNGRPESMLEGLPGECWILHSEGHVARADAGGVTIERSDGRTLIVDSTQTVWLLTKSGLLHQRKKGGWVELPGSAGFQNRACSALATDVFGNVWIAREDELWLCTAGGLRLLGSGAGYTGIDGFRPTPQGSVWVRCQTVFRLRDQHDWKSPPVDTGVRWIQAAVTDASGTLWMGEMGRGMTRVDSSGVLVKYQAPAALVSDRISSLIEDREGTMWAGFFDGGLQQMRRRLFRSVGAAQGVSAMVPTSITEDRDGAIWVAGHGGALTRLDAAGASQLPFAGMPSALPARVVFTDRDGTVWAGTFDHGLWRRGGGQMERMFPEAAGLRNTRAIFQDRSGALWIGTDDGLFLLAGDKLTPIELPEAPPQSKVCGLAQTRDGSIWAASEGAGVYHIVGTRAARLPVQLPTNLTSMVFVDEEDALWIGVKGGGLHRWHRAVHSVIRGFPSESPLAMCDDGRGNFWFTSPNGIIRVAKRQLRQCAEEKEAHADFLLFDKTDGMTTAQCIGGMHPSLYQARDGSIWA